LKANKANNNVGTVSGSSAGSGVYITLLSAFYSDPIPKNLAITGQFETEKKEIPNKISSVPKK
jgi:predicted ATP-dependent protease